MKSMAPAMKARQVYPDICKPPDQGTSKDRRKALQGLMKERHAEAWLSQLPGQLVISFAKDLWKCVLQSMHLPQHD